MAIHGTKQGEVMLSKVLVQTVEQNEGGTWFNLRGG